MSELRDRLEALANRGTRRGADDVLSAAQRDAQTGATDDMSELDNNDMTIIDDELPVVTLEPRRRKRFGSFVASAGIAALVGVGMLAVTAMFGSGGADSPEGAVRQLADAISSKDPLAAVDVLVPSEVRTLRETVDGVSNRAADLKIVSEAGKPLEGVDFSVDNLVLRTEPLADGYAKVIVTGGEIATSTHRAELSPLLQRATRDGEDSQSSIDLATLADDPQVGTFVVAVRQGGGWYVSPAYTAFEYARQANDSPAADFGSSKTAELGAATPEAAVTEALHAAQAGDWQQLFALAPPDELPLYDYRAMLAAELADSGKPDFTIDNLSTKATINGDTATVELTASGVFGDDQSKWQVGGSCPYTPFFDDSGDGSNHGFCFSGSAGSVLPFTIMSGIGGDGGSGPASVSLVRVDGRWFVSPVSTLLASVDSAIANVDERTVYSLLGLAYELPPDGTITIDQPFEVSSSRNQLLASRVYAFEGRAGQHVVGETKSAGAGADSNYQYTYGAIYTADGERVGSIDFQVVPSAGEENYLYTSSTRLPKTGSYKLVLEPYWAPNDASATLTLWDLENAPQKLRAATRQDSVSECESSGGFSLGGTTSECSFATTPTTFVVPPTTTGSTGSSQSSSGSGPVTETTFTAPASTIVAPSTTIGK